MTKEEQNKIVYNYQEYITKLIEDEFYTIDFLKYLAKKFGYKLVKEEQNE